MSNDPSDEIKDIISNVLGVNKGLIDEEFSPHQVDNWDSMHHMRIIVFLEKKFGVMFEADQITDMVNFRKILAAVIAKL